MEAAGSLDAERIVIAVAAVVHILNVAETRYGAREFALPTVPGMDWLTSWKPCKWRLCPPRYPTSSAQFGVNWRWMLNRYCIE